MVPFFDKFLNMRNTISCGYLPVNCTDIIAGDILPNIREFNALSPEKRDMNAGLLSANPCPGQNINRSDFLYQVSIILTIRHYAPAQGIGTILIISSMTESTTISSASARYVKRILCRRTSCATAFTSSGRTYPLPLRSACAFAPSIR
ncbi:MAG: hypothetical protein BWY05_01161 [Euryarchaeota archaeon ADurb.Bin165]|nr:MAG: hypothetical protein BWY05_01161 [Euryarchaeota archaeon ADurb.Bin165]